MRAPAPLLLFALLPAALSSCSGMFERHNQNRALQLQHDNALYFRRKCVEALERARAVSATQTLPRALGGQPCTSPLLGDYAVGQELAATVKGSVILLDATRLSDYQVTVTGLNGQSYQYIDRGDADAAAEQAGTFTETAPDVTRDDGETATSSVDEQTP